MSTLFSRYASFAAKVTPIALSARIAPVTLWLKPRVQMPRSRFLYDVKLVKLAVTEADLGSVGLLRGS